MTAATVATTAPPVRRARRVTAAERARRTTGAHVADRDLARLRAEVDRFFFAPPRHPW